MASSNWEQEQREYSLKIVNSTPSPRVAQLIEDVRDNMYAKNTPFRDMGSIYNEETAKLPVIVRKAMAERQKLERVPVGIWDGQILAGCFTLRNEKIINTYDLPVFATMDEIAEGEKYGFGVYSMFGHISPNYPRLLTLGTQGIIRMARERLETAETEKNRAFLQAAIISLEGFEKYAERHVDMLREKAQKETDEKRRGELLRTAEALQRCPREPAETFLEACQAAWLMHLAFQLTDNHLALGRPDQYLWPYLEKDLRAGRITFDEAQELADCYMLKFNERAQDNSTAAEAKNLKEIQEKYDRRWRERKITDIGQQRYNVRDEIDATNHWNQNIMLGGVKPEDGSDATNLLTIMLLESFHRMRMTNPVTSVRIHSGTPDYLLRQVSETLKTGGGLPCIYNDDVILKAYERFGFDIRDARDYANNGCWEIILPGRTDFYFIKINTLKCLEWTLNHGRCHVDNKQEVPDQGDAALIDSFDELYRRVLENIRLVMEESADHMVKTQHLRSIVAPTPLLSAMLEGPIEKGQDMTEMGTRFIVGGTIAEGISHVIDSLCAIREVVFEKRECTMGELVKAIDQNFAGYEALRTSLASCPKYGANDPKADRIGAQLIHDYSAAMSEIDAAHPEMKFMPGVGTFSWYIAVGEGTGASADGRRLGEPVASNFSPSAGAMEKGITGAIQSFCRMNLDMLPLGSPIDLGMSERYVAGEAGTERLMGLLRSFAQLDGNMLTISVANVETLRQAQLHPENYRDLRVRMGGWSAYFTMLSPEQQEHHIRKSEAGFF